MSSLLSELPKCEKIEKHKNDYLGYHDNDRHLDIFSTPQKLPHTTVDIPTKFHEV
jgi:hypothetical protein